MQFIREKFPDSKLFGTDIAQKSIEIAKSQNPYCEFFTLDDQKTDKSFYQFDLIFVAGVFIFEHNPYNPITRKLVRECPFDKDAVLLTKSEMIKLLERSNFKGDTTGYCLFIPPKFSYLLKLEKNIDWFTVGWAIFC